MIKSEDRPLSIAPPWAAQLAVREPLARGQVMSQTWSDLLFLHWAWDPQMIQDSLPEGLEVDTFDGKAWLAIVPFYMRHVRPRFLPSVPWISHFLELNVRTYVRDKQGRPGVWFYSLDCNQPVAVWMARTFFHLPYQFATMKAAKDTAGGITYDCHRKGQLNGSRYHYRIDDLYGVVEPGTLEFFLVERYLLFASSPRGIRAGRVHHVPYPVAKAEVSEWNALPIEQAGFSLPDRAPDHICASRGVKVKIFGLGD